MARPTMVSPLLPSLSLFLFKLFSFNFPISVYTTLVSPLLYFLFPFPHSQCYLSLFFHTFSSSTLSLCCLLFPPLPFFSPSYSFYYLLLLLTYSDSYSLSLSVYHHTVSSSLLPLSLSFSQYFLSIFSHASFVFYSSSLLSLKPLLLPFLLSLQTYFPVQFHPLPFTITKL